MTYRLKAPAIFDANMAGVEHLYTNLGAEGFAKLMAEALRSPEPRREILDAIARLLDPRPDDDLRLVVERRSPGNTKMRETKRYDDIQIALAVLNFELESGNSKRGSRKKAVGEIAAARGISTSKVEKALRVLSLIPK
jgi:hypothetical protein